MSLARMNLDDFLTAVRLAIDNTLTHPEMLAAVEPYGYTADALSAVRERLLLLESAASYCHHRRGLRIGATHALQASRHRFRLDVYTPHLTIARLTFSTDPAIQTRLGLKGKRGRALDHWLGQARTFYDNALADPDILQRLAARGVREADLSAARSRLAELASLDSAREDAKGLAQQATRDRDALRSDLRRWLSDYRRIARLALRDNPEWLERIGIVHRSTAA